MSSRSFVYISVSKSATGVDQILSAVFAGNRGDIRDKEICPVAHTESPEAQNVGKLAKAIIGEITLQRDMPDIIITEATLKKIADGELLPLSSNDLRNFTPERAAALIKSFEEGGRQNPRLRTH